ncbi:hypothetical protein CT676_27550 [Bradyrhizobium sp. MOS001]|uniref:hypothetical protein n=1 Tax=Bradyrhizobium sp. MOS001 TaxID=2133948 RepID=UPI0010752ED0|nr:hypothetical protein [Bradyrhizobium sp. MOS001]TFW57953.1 hypothetical protein CT676_27550 [Bradyrhizobium sp. MOS001]
MNYQIDAGHSYRNENYRARERIRVKRLYSRTKHGTLGGFSSSTELVDWWIRKFDEQDGRCAYCETSIDRINRLINADLLRTRKVKRNGKRGPCLELERKNPNLDYSPENCALICYYCNNDKSYVYSEAEYRQFFAPARARHFEYLAQKI